VTEHYGQSSRAAVVERYRRNAAAFEALIAATPSTRWEDPSPCEGWTARDVVRHVVGLTADMLLERDVELTPSPPVDVDPLESFRAASSDLERVLADPSVASKRVNYLDAALSFDVAQHWWDLAKATGQDATMDPDFVATTWELLCGMTPEWWEWQRDTISAYGPPVTVPAGAPLQDRLLGLLGRDPHWTKDARADG
jgi:uncharacterized protein (TIGR03086 family)